MYVTILRGEIEKMEGLNAIMALVEKIQFRRYPQKNLRQPKQPENKQQKGAGPAKALVEAD